MLAEYSKEEKHQEQGLRCTNSVCSNLIWPHKKNKHRKEREMFPRTQGLLGHCKHFRSYVKYTSGRKLDLTLRKDEESSEDNEDEVVIVAVRSQREHALWGKPCACIISCNLDSNYCGYSWRIDEAAIKHLIMSNLSIATHTGSKRQTHFSEEREEVLPGY